MLEMVSQYLHQATFHSISNAHTKTSKGNTNLNYMTIPILNTGSGILANNQLGQIQCTLPRLKPSFVEIRLDITMFQPGDQLFVVLLLGAIFCHELSTDVKHLTTGKGDASLSVLFLIAIFRCAELGFIV